MTILIVVAGVVIMLGWIIAGLLGLVWLLFRGVVRGSVTATRAALR